MIDKISAVRISSCYLPLAHPISDAKVLTGRQKPMTGIAMLFAKIETADGHGGLGARDDAMAMQFLIPGWTFNPKRPALDR